MLELLKLNDGTTIEVYEGKDQLSIRGLDVAGECNYWQLLTLNQKQVWIDGIKEEVERRGGVML